uniref:Protoporphyrinogen oxidase n=1 Tax=Spongospora subterranea TaxID=70186 RepID=A0A0H5RMA5_9EUKA|eukprot:CRZ09854.1 hypothetical protein [Spongospora subterranea]
MSSRKILIVGGGITGLTLCHEIQRLAPATRILLCEKSSRLGGWLHTAKYDDARYETGPRSLNRIKGQLTLQLCDRLGLSDKIIPASQASNVRYIVAMDGKIHPLPSSLIQMFKSPLTKAMPLHAIRDLLWPKAPTSGDISVDHFFRERLGPETTDLLISAMTAGIYSGDPSRLSMRSCFPAVADIAVESKSLVRGLLKQAFVRPHQPPCTIDSPNWTRIQQRLGKASMYSLIGGLSTLNETLEDGIRSCQNTTVLTDVEVTSICTRDLRVRFDNGNSDNFDIVYHTGRLNSLSSTLSESSSLKSLLDTVHYASLAVVSFGWRKDIGVPKGFGVLVPKCVIEAPQILGITFDSRTFPGHVPNGYSHVTVMMGGDRHPALVNTGDSNLTAIALDAVKCLLGISAEPDFKSVDIAREAIPQFYVGHGTLIRDILCEASRLNKNLKIMGTAISGVSINDCIKAATTEALDFANGMPGRTTPEYNFANV